MAFPDTNFIPRVTVITDEWLQAVNDRLQPVTDVGDVALKPELAASSGSSLVGYLPAGPGAVPTTVQAKLRESVSVLDFGAVGDGVADDTAAIQAALTAGAGKVVLLPAGRYLVTSTLLMTAGTTLRGDGSGFGINTIIETPTDIITLSNVSTMPSPVYGMTVSSIRFENSLPVVAGAGMTNVQVKFVDVALCVIEDCTVVSKLLDTDYNANNAGGIEFTANTACWLNRVDRCGVQGQLRMFCTDSIINECYSFGLNGNYGIWIKGGNVAVIGCFDINGSKVNGGIFLDNVTVCKIVGNFFDYYGYGIVSNGGYGNVISNNTWNGSEQAGMFLNDPLSFTISGNSFVNCGREDIAAFQPDIAIRGVTLAPNGNVVSHNTHIRNTPRTNQNYAIVEINGGVNPEQNVYIGNTIRGSSTQYVIPAINVIQTTGANASKVSANSGYGSETENIETYTPVWSTYGDAPAIGNGSLTGEFSKQGNTITVNIEFTVGSTTTFGTLGFKFSLPRPNGANSRAVGTCCALLSSTSTYTVGACLVNQSSITTDLLVATGNQFYGFDAATPFAWAAGDRLTISVTYITELIF